ncbi:MAG: hypothetical protein SGJ27_10400 [Candidatus Melainabacteria bacterium]|nr:hypothetical protein [Candidatus Melainabacteria bacterium]
MNLSSSNNGFDGRFQFGAFLHDMDDFAAASLLFNDNLETCMTLTDATTADRRFTSVRGRTTNFLGFEDVTYRRVHGRFGGDTGNRKRRVATRIDNFVEHQVRTRVSQREGREAIEYGVAEYETSRRQSIATAKRNARTMHSFDGTPIETTPEGMIRNGRTGALVEVIVRKSPRDARKAALAGSVKRTRLSPDDVRAMMGLPARS